MLPLGLPFAEVAVSTEWSNWPSLPDLFPKSFPGVKTSRDSFVVDIDFGSGDAVMPGQGRAAARLFGAGTGQAEKPVDMKVLHAKIGELALENDFLESALTKAGLPGARR